MGQHGRDNHSDYQSTCPVCKAVVSLGTFQAHLMAHTKRELVLRLMRRTPTRAVSKSSEK